MIQQINKWQYVVKDDFLRKDHFDYFCSIPHTIGSNDLSIISKNQIKDDIVKCASGFVMDENMVRDVHNTYKDIMWDILNSLAPEKKQSYSYTELNLVCTGKDYVYPIHNDSPDKILSVVIYLSPKNNTGTLFYDTKKGDGKRVVEWKPNRAFFFSRNNETWHSYEGNKIDNRLCLVYNLRSSAWKKN